MVFIWILWAGAIDHDAGAAVTAYGYRLGTRCWPIAKEEVSRASISTAAGGPKTILPSVMILNDQCGRNILGNICYTLFTYLPFPPTFSLSILLCIPDSSPTMGCTLNCVFFPFFEMSAMKDGKRQFVDVGVT